MQYVVIDEIKGCFVGNIGQIMYWLVENDCEYGSQYFFELGDQVDPEMTLIKAGAVKKDEG